ncbi:GAF domain-containing protein [Roseibacillus persicicus]|uniref:GAF domain-containing protein n=1 Tax=Roseibacillus persicicus TaxID=454148 RepID=UPI00398A81D4
MITDNPTAWLQGILTERQCQTGTLHRTNSDGLLELVAAIGVPDHLLPVISNIPFGKGIAGAAAESREPVELCNLQQNLGGVAKEKARDTKVSGSLAVPIFSSDGERVLGTLGVGMIQPHEFSEEEKKSLAEEAIKVAQAWES